MNEQIAYADPWVPVGEDANNLVEELEREVSSSHILSGCQAQAVARRSDNDDVLFKIKSKEEEFAVVHLTWSRKQETDSRWPDTRMFASLDTWVNDCMMKDHKEYLGGR